MTTLPCIFCGCLLKRSSFLVAFLPPMVYIERWATILLPLPSHHIRFPGGKDEKGAQEGIIN